MLNTLTLTPEQEKLARAQAFYLLKKYTSFTLLNKGRALYQGFLDAYANQLSQPLPTPTRKAWVNDFSGYEIGYKELLRYMIPLEEGLQLLRETPRKIEAYTAMRHWENPIWHMLFGRDAHEVGLSYDLFFQNLGMIPEEDQDEKPHTGFIKNNVSAAMSIVGKSNTVISHSKLWDASGDFFSDDQWHLAYNYYSLLSENFYKRDPKYIYPFNFPKNMRECPPHNTNKEGEVWSDNEIQITGIYEPWLLNNKVGCPNYFLAGQKATEYQLEGTQDKEKTRWRLLWEDKRYLDGIIPFEENDYLAEPLHWKQA